MQSVPECVIARAGSADIEHVAGNLRPEHRAEIASQSRLGCAEAVRLSVADSRLVLAGRVDGEALFLAGVSKKYLLAPTGSVWMLATPEIDRYPLEVAVALRRLFRQAHDLSGADILEQWLPPWYRKGIKWLLWLGWRAVGTRKINGTAHIHMIHERAEATHGD